jgi:hypothetical protein
MKNTIQTINGTRRHLKSATLTTNLDGTRTLCISHAGGHDFRGIRKDSLADSYGDGPVTLPFAAALWATLNKE